MFIWLKRIAFFGIVNIAIILMLTIVINLLGLEPYVNAYAGNYTGLFIFCLIWGTGGAFISLWMSKWMAKKFYGVQIVDGAHQYNWLTQSVHQMAKQAGLEKMPEVGVYDSPEINAFATGPSKNNSLVAVSTGLLSKMDRDEAEGVLGHEVAHIANGDMVTMTLIQGIMNAFVMFIARIVAQVIDNAMRDDNGRGGLGFFGYFIVVSVLQVAFGILGQFVVSYFSRWREFRADYGGAALAGKDKMIRALQALQRNYPVMQEVAAHNKERNQNIQTMQISNVKGIMALLSTHPPLEKRIAALQGF